MTIIEAINLGQKRLSSIVERGRFESEILLADILKEDRIYLILNPSKKLLNSEEKLFLKNLKRREAGEPIEYITNRVSFYSREFFIDRGALIPRPETEILIDKVLEAIQEIKNPKILEIGVGSGVISIVLSILRDDLKSLALDISEDALKIAEKNIRRFGVEDRVELRKSNLLQNLKDSEDFDIIVSNPPYISDEERGKLQIELSYEPDEALYGGDVGDEVLREIINLFFERDEKLLACEMGYNQREAIIKYVGDRGELKFYKDLAGFDRGFVIEK